MSKDDLADTDEKSSDMSPGKKDKGSSKKHPGPGSKSKLRSFIERLGDGIIPKKHRKSVLKYLDRASIEEVPYFKFGIGVIIIFFASIILDILLMNTKLFANASFAIPLLFVILLPVIFTAVSGIIILIYKLYLEARIYYKVKQMEEIFPEFLSELALNLKSGQNLDEAIGNSREKQFGYLGQEMETIYKKVRLGTDIEVAIKEFTESFDSDIINETFELMVTSWKKGGTTSQLVDRLYENLEMIRYLKRKVIASVTSYRIFLSIVTMLIAPAMFALSYHLIELIKTITGSISEVSGNAVLPIAINAVRVNNTHFMWFSALALIIMAVCTAMIISIIKTGSIKEGYKQVVLFAAGSIISYRICLAIFELFFSMFNI